MSGRDLLMVAGEASGDLHGARLLGELQRLAPEVRAFGLGGDELAATGLECLARAREISAVGLRAVLEVLPRARQIFRQILAEVDRRRPSTAVLVDFPEFNLRLAPELRRRGVRVVYYISPQIWAWRRGRVRQIERSVDRMLVLFPFEVDFYRQHAVDVVHVGHPLVDEVPLLPQAWSRPDAAQGPFRIALLPGSRESEVRALLPVLLSSVRMLGERLPIEARLIQAGTLANERFSGAVEAAGVPLTVVRRDRFAAIADSHLALCASGTATLEVGLLGTPLMVLYRLGAMTYAMGRLLVRLPHVSLVNLVLGRGAVPELLQRDAAPAEVARRAAALLGDPAAIAAMRRDLAELRPRLGAPGASARAAAEVAALLRQGEAA
ncbi:MAG: lipid-A-disaccharide synthase [Acidobacteriota bacterium]